MKLARNETRSCPKMGAKGQGSSKMPPPKWYVIAKNEYRIHTGRVRAIRPYFPFLVAGLLAAYAVYLAPALVSLFVDEFVALMLSQAALAMVQIVLFFVFIYFMIIPITETLRDVRAGELEILLSAPVRPSDLLLGDFVGEMSFYLIFMTVIAGLFTAALSPLGLGVVQMVVVVAIFILVSASASWIGTVIAAVLRTRLGETARGRDIGKALSFVIALPLVALIYAIQFGGLIQALSDPSASGAVRTVLGLLPSSWGAKVIVGFASEPGGLGSLGLPAIGRLGGLVAFFLGSFYVGSRVADRLYALESASFTSPKAGVDGAFYRALRMIGGGGNFGTLLASTMKEYARRLENLSHLAYILGMIVIMSIFMVRSGRPDNFGSVVPLMMIQFLLPIVAVLVVGEVTLKGKEALFIFRKSPDGVGRFVKARLVQGWLVVMPLAALVVVITAATNPQISVRSVLPNMGMAMLFAAGNVPMVLGLFLINPAFSERSGRFYVDMLVVISLSIVFFVVSMAFLIEPLEGMDPLRGTLHIQASETAMCWSAGLAFLTAGKWNLSRIE